MQAVELKTVPASPAQAILPLSRPVFKTILSCAVSAVVALHFVLLALTHTQVIGASRLCTAAVAALAALAAWWRGQHVASAERFAWRWLGAAVLLWGVAHAVEIFVGSSTAASNLTVDPSDFIYVTAAFPLLLALATTRESASVRMVFLLNTAQIALALLLTYFRLYRMTLTPHAAATVMGKIYGVDCLLLLILASLRYFTQATREEGRTIGMIVAFLMAYAPIELSMDYGSARWNLHEGTMLDLAWSIPFMISAGLSLWLPIDRVQEMTQGSRRKGRLLAETLCPTLISIGVFALAASVASEHLLLALGSILLLLVMQGVQAGLLQVSYLNGQQKLMESERDLRSANAALEQLSLLDPLTCVANRRRLDAALDEAWRRAMRKAQPVSLLIIDLDFFKSINDRHGHGYGDECLVTIAREIERHAGRPDDLLARYGGDEFFLLLPGSDAKGAVSVAEHIQAAVRRLALTNHASPLGEKVTLSIGVGMVRPTPGNLPVSLVEVADTALYEAKRQGRNRSCARTLEPVSLKETVTTIVA